MGLNAVGSRRYALQWHRADQHMRAGLSDVVPPGFAGQTGSVCARSSSDLSRNFERGPSMDYEEYRYLIKMSVYAHICAAMLIGRQRQVFLQCVVWR